MPKNRKQLSADLSKPIQKEDALESDLFALSKMAFHRLEYSREDLTRFHRLKQTHPGRTEPIEILRAWMLCPISLWPVNFQHLLSQALDRLESDTSLEDDFLFFLQTLPPPPSDEVQQVIRDHEFLVTEGRYEKLIPGSSKFQAIDEEASQNPQLRSDWDKIKSRWEVVRFADHKGIIRRTPVSERNMRPDFFVARENKEDRFQVVFDVFCAKWHLYGMQGDTPLVLKLSVNLTAYGTLIFIPAYWSIDSARDFDWKGITRLHKARSKGKQGPGLAEGKAHRRKLARKLIKAEAEANQLRLKGRARHEFLCKVLGWVPETDTKRITRLKREFEFL